MVDLVIPVARVVDLGVCEGQVPFDLRGEVSGVIHGMDQAREVAHAFGRAHKPTKPLMVYGPDNYMPILIIGDGVTEAAEMQDLAEEAIGRQQEAVKRNGGRGMNFDEARERAGGVRREDFGAAFADALARRAAYLKAHQRTEPAARPRRG